MEPATGFENRDFTSPQSQTGFGDIVPVKTVRGVREFAHNNMVPFFRGGVTQPIPGGKGHEDKLRIFTGEDPMRIAKTCAPMSEPMKRFIGTVSVKREDKARTSAQSIGMRRQNEKPVVTQRVGPGLGIDASVPAQASGFHSSVRVIPVNPSTAQNLVTENHKASGKAPVGLQTAQFEAAELFGKSEEGRLTGPAPASAGVLARQEFRSDFREAANKGPRTRGMAMPSSGTATGQVPLPTADNGELTRTTSRTEKYSRGVAGPSTVTPAHTDRGTDYMNPLPRGTGLKNNHISNFVGGAKFEAMGWNAPQATRKQTTTEISQRHGTVSGMAAGAEAQTNRTGDAPQTTRKQTTTEISGHSGIAGAWISSQTHRTDDAPAPTRKQTTTASRQGIAASALTAPTLRTVHFGA